MMRIICLYEGNSMSNLNINWVLSTTTNCVSFTLHALGIYSINAHKKKTNQMLILTNLSIVEMLSTIHAITSDTVTLNRYRDVQFNSTKIMHEVMINTHPPLYQEISLCLYFLLGMQIVLIMTILTTDRLICVINPLKYRANITTPKMKIVLSIAWIVSAILEHVMLCLPI